ncbi:hypothetical protein [Cupriavidus sp. AU9028]|uniref:hypothetical protein n=1 Tax=Cupriavidus sp. AU9028 TaxID=2871157 RepID=UPI001C97E0EF|nr:hypothetical protein [Cupriavidus sp. AU9028]MBY4898898.1 hypothetical protein [Cupriavidus sp. AU9028]
MIRLQRARTPGDGRQLELTRPSVRNPDKDVDEERGVRHPFQLAAAPSEPLLQALRQGDRDEIEKDVQADLRVNLLPAIRYAADNGQALLLSRLLQLQSVKSQLRERFPDAMRLTVEMLIKGCDDPAAQGGVAIPPRSEAADALKQLVEAEPNFRKTAQDALVMQWGEALASLDVDALVRLVDTAERADLEFKPSPIDPFAAVRNEEASAARILHWIDGIACSENLPIVADYREQMLEIHEVIPPVLRETVASQSLPDEPEHAAESAAETACRLIRAGNIEVAAWLLRLLHTVTNRPPAPPLLVALDEATKAGTVAPEHVTALLSAVFGLGLEQSVYQTSVGGASVLHLLVRHRCLALIPIAVADGARLDTRDVEGRTVLDECTSARAARPLMALFDAVHLPWPQSALDVSPEWRAAFVDTLLYPGDDAKEELLDQRAATLTRALLADKSHWAMALNARGSGPRLGGELLNFADSLETRGRQTAAMRLSTVLTQSYDIGADSEAGAWVLRRAMQEGNWKQVARYGPQQTDASGAQELIVRMLHRGAAEKDLAPLLKDAKVKHRQRNPFFRFFLFLWFGSNAWAKMPLVVEGGRYTIVGELEERHLKLHSLLELPEAQ